MTQAFKEVIAAQATPPGIGGVGIVRVSGFNLTSLLQGVLGVPWIKPRYAHFGNFLDEKGEVIDQGITLYFKTPHSFTGEDVIEFQGHGGPVIMDRLLKRVFQLGARMARPGEFSERAYLNGKLDLLQAEAICDLIHAQSEVAAKSAMRSLQGGFSKSIQELVNALIELRMYIEAAIDFPDEEVDFLPKDQIRKKIQALLLQLVDVQQKAKQGMLLQNGANIVIVGPPNSGKSSLLNQLSEQEIAIVTSIPGTTRDLLRQSIQIDGLSLQIVDTAGLREQTKDPIEQEGIHRTKMIIKDADHILLMLDVTQSENHDVWIRQLPEGVPFTLLLNKVDLLSNKSTEASIYPTVYLSAKTGEGLDELKQSIKQSLSLENVPENQFIARRRHLEALNKAEQHLLQALARLEDGAFEFVAEHLKQAQVALSEMTGEFGTEELLEKIFSSFCIGK